MKRVLSLTVACWFLILLLLAGCNSGGAQNDSVTPTSAGASSAVAAASPQSSVVLPGTGGVQTDAATLALLPEALPITQLSASPAASATPLPGAVVLPSQNLPPVLNQGAMSSCGGFAIGYELTTYVTCLQNGTDPSNTSYESSPAYMYAQACIQEGQTLQENKGTTGVNYFDFLIAVGSQTDEQFPYFGQNNDKGYDSVKAIATALDPIITCSPTPSPETSISKVVACLEAPPSASFELGANSYISPSVATKGLMPPDGTNILQELLANGQPVAFLVNEYSQMHQWGGVPLTDVFTGGTLSGNGHFMLLIGYDNTIAWNDNGTSGQGAFLIQNSWGTQFGQEGLWYMSYPAFAASLWEAYVGYPVTLSGLTPDATGAVLTASGGDNPPGGVVLNTHQYFDKKRNRVNLIFRVKFGGAVRIKNVTLEAPNGQTVSEDVRITERDGYIHFSRRDGLSFPLGEYTLTLEAIDLACDTCGTVEYTGTVKVKKPSESDAPPAGSDLGTKIFGPTGNKPLTVHN